MARSEEDWERKRYFDKHGEWPSPKNKKKASPVVSRQIAQAAEPVTSSAWSWALKNPEMSKYDNDGNPVDMTHWMGH